MSRTSLPPDVRRALDEAAGRGAASRETSARGASGRTADTAGTLGFDPDAPLYVARAPGRLDLMGGIADYSGSEVLQMPIREAAVVLLQRTDEPFLEITSAAGGVGGTDGRSERVRLPLADLLPPAATSLDAARAVLSREPRDAWAGYVAGVFPVLAAHGVRFDADVSAETSTGGSADARIDAPAGTRIHVVSDVPEGKGVSSSAALEVATMRAVAAAWNVPLDAHETALLCQRVENAVVGAPCGLMDQMTSSVGRAGRLLSMRCQPDRVLPDVPIPADLSVFGIDSGVRHAVGGADYGAVRTAAFMGYRLLLERAGIADASVPARDIVDPRWSGYLANVTPSELQVEVGHGGSADTLLDALPVRMRGADFLARFDATTDAVTRVDPERDYDVRAATLHPVHEHVRVRMFRHLLQGRAVGGVGIGGEGSGRDDGHGVAPGEDGAAPDDDSGTSLGELMYASHASYSACGLGSAATDRLVALARAAGPGTGVLGARITGGGSGGTVAILARRGAASAVERIADAYRSESGHEARLFDGSSDGALAWRLDTYRSADATPVPVPPPGD